MKFDIKHWKDIEKLAIIGESKWEAGMAAFCKPFTSAKIKYFEQSNLEGAREWIVAD
ncbi:MAG: STAS/SEC14 domain-containing protein [Verrucomicrobia bacterium]|nr:STAS/SEC14 domain-containing protein [Verrucomicrobiota bacterium]